MTDTTASTLDQYFVPSIDTDKLNTAIQKYRDDHPQRYMGDDSDTHAMMADMVNAFVDRELGSFPMPLGQLEWPQIFWAGLMAKYGLFFDKAPAIQLISVDGSSGVIFFAGEEVGRFGVVSGEQALELVTQPMVGVISADEDFDDPDPQHDGG